MTSTSAFPCANRLKLPSEMHCASIGIRYTFQKSAPILGNPPFVGHHYQSAEQKADQQHILGEISACGVLDYVSNWYTKEANYIQNTPIRCALVSTNSITKGEQVALLWNYLFQR